MTKSLWNLAPGDVGLIDSFDDALPESYRNRLMEMGFYPGARVSCLQAPALGAPRVYRVSNTTFSLDDAIAQRLRVRFEV